MVTVAGVVLGFLASVDVYLLSPWSFAAAAWLFPLLLLAGIGGGLAARCRGQQIDVRRWAIVADSDLTSGEREYAHKEAERERRLAATAYLTAPLALGYWAAYQAGGTAATMAVQLLPAVPLAGFALGWWFGRRWEGSGPAPTDR